MAQMLNEQFIRMQKLAGVITESQYATLTQQLTEQQLEEGWKEWLLGGLITLSTAAGVGKVVQMDREREADIKARTEYYEKFLETPLNDLFYQDENDQLFNLGVEISDKTGDIALLPTTSAEDARVIFRGYAMKYIRQHPEQFSVSVDGKTIVWNQSTNVQEVEGGMYTTKSDSKYKLRMVNDHPAEKMDKTVELDFKPTTMFGGWDEKLLKDICSKNHVASGTDLYLMNMDGDVIKKGEVIGWKPEGPIIYKK